VRWSDLAVGGDDDDQLGRPGVELHVVEGDHVGRVRRRHRHPVALALQHHYAAALGDGTGQQTYVLGHHDRAAQVDQR